MVEDLLEQFVRIYSYFPRKDGYIFKTMKPFIGYCLKLSLLLLQRDVESSVRCILSIIKFMGHRCFKRSVAMKRDESLVHTKADKLFPDKEDPTEQKRRRLWPLVNRIHAMFAGFHCSVSTSTHSFTTTIGGWVLSYRPRLNINILCTVFRNHCERFRSTPL